MQSMISRPDPPLNRKVSLKRDSAKPEPAARASAAQRTYDPAPSKTKYRIQRLWLTPIFRALVRTGIPAFAVMAAGAWYVSDETRVDQVKLKVSELRVGIEQRPEFMINLMRIEDVSAEVAEDVREITAVDFPISSFDLDLDQMRAQILELDAVSRAELVVRSGGVLDIEVTERVPLMIWRGRAALELLDGLGHRVAPLAKRADRRDLPLIVGDGADKEVPQALEIFAAALPIKGRLRGLARIGDRRWNLVLEGNRRIYLPANNPIAALERILALHSINGLLDRDFHVIDMRNSQRPTVRLSPDAVDFLRDKTNTTDKDDA